MNRAYNSFQCHWSLCRKNPSRFYIQGTFGGIFIAPHAFHRGSKIWRFRTIEDGYRGYRKVLESVRNLRKSKQKFTINFHNSELFKNCAKTNFAPNQKSTEFIYLAFNRNYPSCDRVPLMLSSTASLTLSSTALFKGICKASSVSFTASLTLSSIASFNTFFYFDSFHVKTIIKPQANGSGEIQKWITLKFNWEVSSEDIQRQL